MPDITSVSMDDFEACPLSEPGDCLSANDLSGCTVLAVYMQNDMGFMAHFGSLTLNDEEKGPKLVKNVGGTLGPLLQQYPLMNAWLYVSADRDGERFSTGNDLIRDWLRANLVVFQEKKYRSDQGDTHVIELLHGGEIAAPSDV